MSLPHPDVQRGEFAVASHFREVFYEYLTRRRDGLFEVADALLCADGPLTTPVDLTLLAEHRPGHGALYAALNEGRIDAGRLGGHSPRCPSRRPPTNGSSWRWT